MAGLQEALEADRSGYLRAERPALAQGLPPERDVQPGFNPMLRCPLPPVSATSDSLRQFYRGGQVPQSRLLPSPSSPTQNGGGTVVTNTTVVTTSTATSSASTIAATQVSLTTPALNPNIQFAGSVLVSRSFQLISLTASGACRIQVYGSAVNQTADLARALDVPPAAGTMPDLITDLALDSSPYQWRFQNRVGTNTESPQKTIAYITVTNLDQFMTQPITVTISYVPLEA
jgi:hypothetical protein